MIGPGLSHLVATALAVLVAQNPPAVGGPAAATQVAMPAPLGQAGLFQKGINVDLLEIGAIEAFGAGGHASGIVLGLGPELDLGPRAALRIPLRVGFAGSAEANSFAELVIAPGVVYRFRHDQAQRWVPFAGGGLALGGFQFGRHLLGLAPSPASVSQASLKVGVAPEALGGFLYCPASFVALRMAASYSYMFVARTSAHALTETIDLRFMF